jgi:fatty-acyl-CoA synthase
MFTSVGDLLTKRAHLTPGRVALVEQPAGRCYTYRELNERANRLANWLRNDLDVQKGDRVSILAYNGVAYLDLLYGLTKIGAILAPLNWRLAARELAYIASDCQPRVLVVGPEFADLASELGTLVSLPIVAAVDGATIPGAVHYEDALETASPEEPVRPPLDPDDTACLLYTSGTTGRPKGAMIPHRQIFWNCINTAISWGLTENDVSPILTPLFHAGGLFAFMTPLLYLGGRVVAARTFDIDESLRLIQDEGCTVILGVPTIFKMWLETPALREVDFSHVRFFISGGAPLPVSLIDDWLAAKGGVLRQGYGLTEVGTNCFSMTDQESVTKRGSVGKPIFHSQMRLVDTDGRDVPVGETGELLIAGPHVTTGYWGNAAASAQSLRDGPGGPWFHTGDMARMDTDGFFTIVGRFKDMIISGGENVYAAEVEAVFREHPSVSEAALIGKPDEQWGEVGVMVVVLKEGEATGAADLQRFCGERLARYKVPKRIVFAEALPYSSYGKVLKSELKKRYIEKGDAS